MADLRTRGRALEFAQLIRRLFEAYGLHRTRLPAELPVRPDLLFEVEGVLVPVEVKYYRAERVQLSLIANAAAQLAALAHSISSGAGILVVSSDVPPAASKKLESEFGVLIADRTDVVHWAQKVPDEADLAFSLLELEGPDQAPRGGRSIVEFLRAAPPISLPTVPPPPTTGGDLCQELRVLPRGRATWSQHEALCERILRYLFSEDLTGWRRQQRTFDGLNRFDLVCRVDAKTAFWGLVVRDLGSRYVVFEFKNYGRGIDQGQILTTEKYLFERSLRKVAFVLSRVRASESARAMARGAMRESGKLIVVLSDTELCEMLSMKDRGEDPTDLLFDLVDDLLLSLSR